MCNFTNSFDQICTFRIALTQFILASPLFKDTFSYFSLWLCGFPLKISIVVVLVFMQFQQSVCYHGTTSPFISCSHLYASMINYVVSFEFLVFCAQSSVFGHIRFGRHFSVLCAVIVDSN